MALIIPLNLGFEELMLQHQRTRLLSQPNPPLFRGILPNPKSPLGWFEQIPHQTNGR
jgi:hypothetical protein